MFCTECGKPIKSGYKFCPYCGARMDQDLMDPPELDVFSTQSEDKPPEDPPIELESEFDFFSDIPPLQDCDEDLPDVQNLLDQQEPSATALPEDSETLEPPPNFTFEEETFESAEDEAQDAPYFVYHPKEEPNHTAVDLQKKPVENEYHPGNLKKRPAAMLAPILTRSPSLGFKVLLIILIVSAALAASVVGYQFLFTKEPFADGWLFGM